jgi:glutamate synthase domain-containing protein 2
MHSIRTDADVAKALALDADAVAIGQGVLMALGCGRDTYQQAGQIHSAEADYAVLENRLEPDVGAKHVTNYLKTLALELTTLARACGTQDVHHLEPEDLVALTVEAAGGTQWIPGQN